jgi:hypothetical protein
MRITNVVALALAFAAVAVAPTKGQTVASPNRQGFLTATPSGCRVTITRNGVLTGSFVFPPGTRLSVVGNLQDSAAVGLGPFQFRFTGAFELRVLPVSDVPSPQSPSTVALMTLAPIVMTGSPGVELLIENGP